MFRTLLSFAAVAGLTAVSAFAADWKIGNAKVPFAFRAGSSTMPAGNYDIEAPHGKSVPLLTFRNLDTGDVATILAPIAVSPIGGAENGMTTVNFLCAGAECSFYRVFPGGMSGGWSVSKPKFKNELGQTIAPSELKLATVVVALRTGD